MSKTININTNEIKKMMQNATLTTSKEKDSILSNALLEINTSEIKITSRNNIVKSIQKVEIEPQDIEANLIINPNIVFNILKELKEETTEITIEENLIKIKNGKFKTTIKTLNNELYPEEQNEKGELITTIDFNKLKHLFKSSIPYPDKNDVSREYTGIFTEIENDKMKASSTDHFRLINIETDIDNNNKTISFIIEHEGASVISKIDMEETVELYKGNNTITIKDNLREIQSKLIEGSFPNYQTILLDETNNYVIMERNELLSSIKRVSITNQNNEIELEIKPNEKILTVTSKNQEGEESIDETSVTQSNNDNEIKIKLDSRFAINFLSQVTTNDIKLLYRSNEEPIMMQAKEEEYIYNYIMTPIVE